MKDMDMGKTNSPSLISPPLVPPHLSTCSLTLSQGRDIGLCEFGSRSSVPMRSIHSCSISPFCKFYEVGSLERGVRLMSTADDVLGYLWSKPCSVGGHPICLSHACNPEFFSNKGALVG